MVEKKPVFSNESKDRNKGERKVSIASRQTNTVVTRFVPYLTIYYYFFDQFKEFLKTNASTVTTNLLSGALAGGVAKTTIAPLDRAKINFQIQYVLMDFTLLFFFFLFH